MPCCRNGVTTMKMIKSTNMTSTIGVTLISDCNPPPPPPCIPISQTPFVDRVDARAVWHSHPNLTRQRMLRIQLFRAVLDEIVDQFRSRVIHLHDEAINFAGKVVEQPDRRHGDYQSKRSRKECFG